MNAQTILLGLHYTYNLQGFPSLITPLLSILQQLKHVCSQTIYSIQNK